MVLELTRSKSSVGFSCSVGNLAVSLKRGDSPIMKISVVRGGPCRSTDLGCINTLPSLCNGRVTWSIAVHLGGKRGVCIIQVYTSQAEWQLCENDLLTARKQQQIALGLLREQHSIEMSHMTRLWYGGPHQTNGKRALTPMAFLLGLHANSSTPDPGRLTQVSVVIPLVTVLLGHELFKKGELAQPGGVGIEQRFADACRPIALKLLTYFGGVVCLRYPYRPDVDADGNPTDTWTSLPMYETLIDGNMAADCEDMSLLVISLILAIKRSSRRERKHSPLIQMLYEELEAYEVGLCLCMLSDSDDSAKYCLHVTPVLRTKEGDNRTVFLESTPSLVAGDQREDGRMAYLAPSSEHQKRIHPIGFMLVGHDGISGYLPNGENAFTLEQSVIEDAECVLPGATIPAPLEKHVISKDSYERFLCATVDFPRGADEVGELTEPSRSVLRLGVRRKDGRLGVTRYTKKGRVVVLHGI